MNRFKVSKFRHMEARPSRREVSLARQSHSLMTDIPLCLLAPCTLWASEDPHTAPPAQSFPPGTASFSRTRVQAGFTV